MLEHETYGPLYTPPKTLPDGRIAYVTPLTFGRARINVGDQWSVFDAY